MATECSSATIRYRLNLAHALLAASPALSALHTTRAAVLHPEISAILPPSHCPKCGTYRFSGDHPIHPPARNPNKRKRATSPQSKSLQMKCHLCDFSVDVEAPTSPPLTDSEEAPLTGTFRPISETVSITVSTSPPLLPARQYHPKSGPTKASALKDMLSRDRQREGGMKARKKKEDGHEGLTAFLKQL